MDPDKRFPLRASGSINPANALMKNPFSANQTCAISFKIVTVRGHKKVASKKCKTKGNKVTTLESPDLQNRCIIFKAI